MKKLIRNLEKNNAYDSDEERNPYASSVCNEVLLCKLSTISIFRRKRKKRRSLQSLLSLLSSSNLSNLSLYHVLGLIPRPSLLHLVLAPLVLVPEGPHRLLVLQSLGVTLLSPSAPPAPRFRRPKVPTTRAVELVP
jgi:hypothetical protein